MMMAMVEVVTGGYDNGLTNSSGQLRVWHWNGEDLTTRSESGVANGGGRLRRYNQRRPNGQHFSREPEGGRC